MCESDIIVEPLAKRRQVIDWNNIKDILRKEIKFAENIKNL